MRIAPIALLVGAAFTAQAATVALSWTASTTTPATFEIRYNVFRADGACSATSAFTKLTATPVTATSYSDLNVPVGTYCYQAIAVIPGYYLDTRANPALCSPLPVTIPQQFVVDCASTPSRVAANIGPATPAPPTGLTITVTIAATIDLNGVTLARKDSTLTIPIPQQ